MVKQNLEQATEIEALKEKVRQLEADNPNKPVTPDLMNQLAMLKRKQVKSNAHIPYKIVDDHVNVFLYTKSNHRVGPLHPNNAVETMMRWAAQGVQLYVKPFSDAEVAEYKKSKEWTDFMEKNRRNRVRMKKKDLNETLEEFAKIIAKNTPSRIEAEAHG